MSEYRTVEGAVSTVDTLTNLTTFANETSVGPIKVPAGASRVTEVWASFGVETEDSEIQSYLLRLSGKGMRTGEQDFNIGSGAANGTLADIRQFPATVYPVNIGVVPNENITVSAAVAGSALASDGQVAITLRFD